MSWSPATQQRPPPLHLPSWVENVPKRSKLSSVGARRVVQCLMMGCHSVKCVFHCSHYRDPSPELGGDLWPSPIWLRLVWHGFYPTAKLSRSLLPKMGWCRPYWFPTCSLWKLGGGICAYRPAAQGRRKAWPHTWSIPTLGSFTLLLVVLAFVSHHLPDIEHRCIRFTPPPGSGPSSMAESCVPVWELLSCLPDPFLVWICARVAMQWAE